MPPIESQPKDYQPVAVYFGSQFRPGRSLAAEWLDEIVVPYNTTGLDQDRHWQTNEN